MSASIDEIVKRLRKSASRSEIALLEKAFETADKAHHGQLRKSGDPYITHPVAVAEILADLGLDIPTTIAALLHDTIEDTPYSLEEARKDFGDEVANLVDGVTKLDKLTYGPTAEAETVRKMVVAMSKDIRVLVIKLCDRLHNARTWQYVPLESAQRKAKETLEIYAPLANRLGINSLKWELEDLSFQALEPKKFEEIDYTDESYQSELDRIEEKFTPLVLLCKANRTAMRIGTNHGSLSDRIMNRFGDSPLGMVESALKQRRHKPMVMIDLAVPRDFEPEISRLDDVYLYTVDDLGVIIQTGVNLRQAAVSQAEAIIEDRVGNFMHWMQGRNAVPLIQDIQQQGERLRQLELERAMKRLMRGDDPQEVLSAMAQGLTNKFLHGSLHALQHSNGAERDALIKLLPKLFASHTKPEDH